jgi:hypothetical protein
MRRLTGSYAMPLRPALAAQLSRNFLWNQKSTGGAGWVLPTRGASDSPVINACGWERWRLTRVSAEDLGPARHAARPA